MGMAGGAEGEEVQCGVLPALRSDLAVVELESDAVGHGANTGDSDLAPEIGTVVYLPMDCTAQGWLPLQPFKPSMVWLMSRLESAPYCSWHISTVCPVSLAR